MDKKSTLTFRRFAATILMTGVFAVSFASSAFAAGEKVLINGAGATFPAPIYTKWFQDYNQSNPNIEINYQSIGSGGGIKQLTAKTVDFGASDAPMSDEEIQKAGGSIVHVPTVLGAVVVTYNLDAVKKSIKLDGPTIAEIYSGKIQKWNDPKLVALNPGVAFPDQQIVVVYRSDSSGTTAVFTEYLAKISPTWKTEVGAGKAVKWPAGLGGKGNEGVMGQVKNTKGALGYVELSYALTEKMPVAEVKNKAGQFVMPSLETVSEAAKGALKNMPEDFRVSITDPEGMKSYPIAAFTYLLMPGTITGTKGAELVKFLNWAMDKGQQSAPGLKYSPLPKEMVAKVKEKIKTIKVN